MSRKQNNFRRSGGGGHRRFGGTGSLGNYNRGAGFHDGPANNQHSGGLVDGANFNRSFDNSNNNSFGNTNAKNKDYERFQKFRDPHAHKQRNNYMRDGRKQNYGRRWEKQNFGNETRTDNENFYEDRQGNKPLQFEQQNQGEINQLPQQQPLIYPTTTCSPTPAALPLSSSNVQTQIQNGHNIESEKLELDTNKILKNIKQEKIKEVSKTIIKPPPSSSSSSSSSDSSDGENAGISKTVQPAVNTKSIKTETSTTKSTKNVVKPHSSSSSSSSSEDESDNAITATSKSASKTSEENIKKLAKKKQSSEEDLICLGKLEKKFVIEDDASEEASNENVSGQEKNNCLICDKRGHTSFECQMICKNCSAPYHNMKSCPKPANLSIVMQSFMEFCMGQMNQFNPEQKFTLPWYIGTNENKLTKQNPVISNKKTKKAIAKSQKFSKKVTKRKRKNTAESSDEEDDDNDDEEIEKDDTEDEQSSQSESESDSSEEVAAPKLKKKRTKATSSTVDSSEYPNTFVPPFPTFPSFGAAAAAYNPLLLSQLMHGGNFGTPKKLNFQ